jgi:hypothetical protein
VRRAVRRPHRREARGRDEDQALDALREVDRQLGADQAAHRVAHEGRGVHPELAADLVDDARVAGDRDVLLGHRRRPESGEVEGDDPVVLGEHRNLLEPVLPAPTEAVHEEDGRPLAERDDVDRRVLGDEPTQVLAPVDGHPGPARPAPDIAVPALARPVQRRRHRGLL